MARDIPATRGLTNRPFRVNIFAPVPGPAEAEVVERYTAACVLLPHTKAYAMGTPYRPHDLPETLAANREELRRRSRAERVRSQWLWIGIVTGPVALAVVRIASIVLLSHDCGRSSGTGILGLSLLQSATAGITVLGALVTIGAGLLSWHVWRQTNLPEDEVSVGNMPRVPFWALGGMLVSGFCLLGIVYMGGLALALSGGCPGSLL